MASTMLPKLLKFGISRVPVPDMAGGLPSARKTTARMTMTAPGRSVPRMTPQLPSNPAIPMPRKLRRVAPQYTTKMTTTVKAPFFARSGLIRYATAPAAKDSTVGNQMTF